MPNSQEEKLSILSEMIAFASVDGSIKESEYDFLLSIASQLDVTKKDFDALFTKRSAHMVLKTYADRIVQFHRLLVLMNIDQHWDTAEISKLHNLGLAMGLPPSAIEQVLSIMHQSPDKLVPAQVLIDIFKAHSN